MNNTLKKQIDTQQKFAIAVNTLYNEKKLGITPCCFSNLVNVTINKYLCDWQNSSSSKTTIYDIAGDIVNCT
tara:strand:+ start:1140 stop:1355 length:216 start_codon:yes stop_codon:yes gene_type:complete